jgi:ElaA protein
MKYDKEVLDHPEHPDRDAFFTLDLPGSELPATIRWVLDENELEAAFEVRREVFIREQGYTEEQEFDEAEGRALHALAQLVPGCATTPGAGKGLGTARLLVDSTTDPPVAFVSRVSVLQHARRLGVGRALVTFLLDAARQLGCGRVRAGAQVTALDFWRTLGFEPTGERYMDFHVEHEWTERELE